MIGWQLVPRQVESLDDAAQCVTVGHWQVLRWAVKEKHRLSTASLHVWNDIVRNWKRNGSVANVEMDPPPALSCFLERQVSREGTLNFKNQASETDGGNHLGDKAVPHRDPFETPE